MIRVDDIRQMTNDEITTKLGQVKKEYFQLRVQAKTGNQILSSYITIYNNLCFSNNFLTSFCGISPKSLFFGNII